MSDEPNVTVSWSAKELLDRMEGKIDSLKVDVNSIGHRVSVLEMAKEDNSTYKRLRREWLSLLASYGAVTVAVVALIIGFTHG